MADGYGLTSSGQALQFSWLRVQPQLVNMGPSHVVSADWDSLGGRIQGTQITYLWKL